MAMRVSVGLRANMLGTVIDSLPFMDVMDGCILTLYSGVQGVTAETVPSGPLGSVNIPSWVVGATNDKIKIAVAAVLQGTATGNASSFRCVSIVDTTCSFNGTVGISTQDMVLPSVSISNKVTVTISTLEVSFPAEQA